ncbi:putative kinetochore protein, partial [Echria macrotheca]
MAQQPPTIISLKHAFLTAQTLTLAQPLSPSRAWQKTNDAADNGLPEKAVADALVRLNHVLSQHCKRAYAPQATRHVAEQVDGLYWQALVRADQDEDEDGEGVDVGVDLADPQTISTLPPTFFPPQEDSEADPQSQTHQQYTTLLKHLTSLTTQITHHKARIARLSALKKMLSPFAADADDLSSTIQPNLVTRGGEMEGELERMRVLLARVG